MFRSEEIVTMRGLTPSTDATGTPTTREGGKFLPATPEISIYDFDGNLTSDGRFTYKWDAENRLIAMQTLATVPVIAQRKLAFAYDAMGRRIRKTTWNGTATGTWQPQLDLRFIHELGGWNILAEITADSKFLRTYTWGPDLSGNRSGAGGVGGLLFTNLRASGKTFAHGMDLNGNVTLLVSTATGRAAATYDYGPFGEPLRQSGEYAKTNPYRFSTKYTDDETGLLDYGHRYYDPVAGRWLSKDPIEEKGGVNLYGFLVNNSNDKIDLIGLSPGVFVKPNHITIFAGHGLENRAFNDVPGSGDNTLKDPASIDRAFNNPDMVPINANVSKTFAAATIIACNAPRYTHVNIPITGYNSPEGEIPLDNVIATEMGGAFSAAVSMAENYIKDGACSITIEVKCYGFSKGLCGTKKIIK